MQAARIRSESTADKYAKKQIEEGYNLWDRDYPLGALRLFIFKAESALPFQQGELLDAASELSVQLNGKEDAKETYAIASDKYRMVQQLLLSEMMTVKILEINEGTAAAIQAMEELIKKYQKTPEEIVALTDKKERAAYARAYLYLAELYLTHPSGVEELPAEQLTKAKEAAQLSTTVGKGVWERVHHAYNVLGDALEQSGDLQGAKEAYQSAVTLCPYYVECLERLIAVSEELSEGTPGQEEHLLLLEALLRAHPSADRLREKAFLLSELQGDEKALAFIAEQLNEGPPQQEMESVGEASSNTACVLLKAKAAILADSGRMKEALEAALQAKEADPDDAETAKLIEDSSKRYFKKKKNENEVGMFFSFFIVVIPVT
ncbi:hypothetical protein AGDE_04960 [Angomonas deanei]|nr:hypothetical protein AGDE_04960 [Angomonas deanei]|eukprot:EPY38969.1 hypothetical protein AGDE_04960 [Angomonas deanei]